jgi:hypothetical protein
LGTLGRIGQYFCDRLGLGHQDCELVGLKDGRGWFCRPGSRCARASICCTDLVDAHVEELGAVVDWRRPSPLNRVARSALAVSRTPWASPSSGISRISLTGSYQRAITGEGQGEDGRAGIVGKDAGVSCCPPGAELWSVEQRSDDKRRPDGPEQVRNVVDLGEVFARERDDGDPLTDLDELDRAAWHAIASHLRM